MSDPIKHLVLHTGIPGRLAIPLERVLRKNRRELAKASVSPGSVTVRGKAAETHHHVARIRRSRRQNDHTWISSAALLGTQHLGSADREEFRPHAESYIKAVINQLRPSSTSIVVESMRPEHVLQLAYAHSVRKGESAAIDDAFDLDHPWVDLMGLRSRLLRLPSVDAVRFIPVDINQAFDPGPSFDAAAVPMPPLLWSDTVPTRSRLRHRAAIELERLPHRFRPGLVRHAIAALRSDHPLLETPGGTSWTRRALEACREVNEIVDGADRRDVHEFIVSLLAHEAPASNTIFTAEELVRIRRAHEHHLAGLFG